VLPPYVFTGHDAADRLLRCRQSVTSIQHVVSIGAEGSIPLARLKSKRWRSLRLLFDDIEVNPNPWTCWQPPTREIAEQIIAFGKDANDGVLLVHCAAGISRSSAALLIILADKLGPGGEDEAVKLLIDARDQTVAAKLREPDTIVRPNRRLVWWGDEVLGRKGALLAACQRTFQYGSTHWSP